jgi:hypothetical protein
MKTTMMLSGSSAFMVLLVTGALAIPHSPSAALAGGEDAGMRARILRPVSRHRKLPGDEVEWIRFPAQNEESNSQWGDFLGDIARHLPSQYGNHYYSDDRITHAHETTHGINSHLSNHLRRGSELTYGFYVGNDQAILLTGPRIKLSQVAALIPESLRGSRYQLYCIDQQKYFEEHPLYLFDEWVAYTNGASAGVELAEKNRLDMPRNDALVGPLEFSVYALGLAAAIQKHDPDYLPHNKQFREFLAHELRRSMRIYRRGMKLDQFRWERRLEHNLLEEDNSRELREIVQQLYGEELTLEGLLGG